MKIYASSSTSEFDQFVGQDVWVKLKNTIPKIMGGGDWTYYPYLKFLTKNADGSYDCYELPYENMDYLVNPPCYLLYNEFYDLQDILDGKGEICKFIPDKYNAEVYKPLTVFTTADIQEMLDDADVREY